MIKNAKVNNIMDLKVNDIFVGDCKLNVLPVIHSGERIKLPESFSKWEENINEIFSNIPVLEQEDCNTHYITIDSKFFSDDGFLRREGIHFDGNFCVDLKYKYKTWGRSGWAGIAIEEVVNYKGDNQIILKDGKHYEIKKGFETPYKLDMEFGDYVSDELGGILVASSLAGCDVWEGDFDVTPNDGGDLSNNLDLFKESNKISLDANKLYFMTSNTPHASTPIKKGNRRTLIRITLNHKYPNRLIRSSCNIV